MARGSAGTLTLGVIAFAVAIAVGTMVGIGVSLIGVDEVEFEADTHRTPAPGELGGSTHFLLDSTGDGDTLHGPASYLYTQTLEPADRVVLVTSKGPEILGAGPSAGTGSIGHRADGLYRIQVERDIAGETNIVAERTFEVRTPSNPSSVAWAAGIGASFSAAASVVAAVLAGQGGVLAQVAQESLIGLGESHMKEAEEKRLAKFGVKPRRKTPAQVRRTVLTAVFITVTLMAVFFTFEEMNATTWREFTSNLPLVAPIAGALAILAFGSEWLLALATGTVARFKVLWSGAITLILSATLLRTAFGFPGYVDEDHRQGEELAPHVEGMRGVAAIAAFPAILLPFVVIGWFRFDVLAVAMNVGLAGLAAVAMPFRPMPGNDIWRWSRLTALTLWAGAFVLFFGFELGFLSLIDFLIVSIVCWMILLGTAAWLFIRRQQPGWYRQLFLDLAAALGQEPGWLRASRQFVARAARRLDGALDKGVAKLQDLAESQLGRIISDRRSRAARLGLDVAREAFAKAGPEIDVLSIVGGNNFVATLTRENVDEALLAAQVDEMFRSLPRTVRQLTVLDPETGEDRYYHRP